MAVTATSAQSSAMLRLLPLALLTLAAHATEGPHAGSIEDRLAALPAGISLIGPGRIEDFKLSGSTGKSEVVDVTGPAFQRAARISTLTRPDARWDLQFKANIVSPVKKGDTLFATFWARALSPRPPAGEAQTQLVLEQNATPYTKCAAFSVLLSDQWQHFYLPIDATLDLDAGKAHLSFLAGYDPQTIEIAGVTLVNYQTSLTWKDLPLMPVSYQGRGADAGWRQAAEERIEKLRKAELKVVVLDAERKPLPNAEVFVRMKRHAYGFGTAVNARLLFDPSADAARYREVFLQNFNKATIENHLKWPVWERERETALRAVTWLRERGLRVRGHVLVWPGKDNLPPRIVDLFSQPAPLRQVVLEHIADELGALRGQCVEWDVMNEPFDNHAVQSILAGRAAAAPKIGPEEGAPFIAEWFQAAHKVDPQASLQINDYGILEAGGMEKPHQDYYERTIRALLAQGAPVNGIGIQGHFNENLTPIPRVIEILDRFGRLGLPIQTTEFDVNTSDEQLQADYTRDFMTAFFSHPSTSGITVWGFWAKSHWIPNAAFYRPDWTLRPAGQVWRDLVFSKWWTEVKGVTDANGVFITRGFLGDYEIKITAPGAEKSVPAMLTHDGTRVEVVIGEPAAHE